MPNCPNRFFLALLLVLPCACSDYDIKVNERVVYTPRALFEDYKIADEALRNCVEQTILDQAITAAGQLEDLVCSSAGIKDLSGLSAFGSLIRLRLSSNQVRNLMEVQLLSQLQELYLDNNRVVDPVPLYSLQQLRFVDLSENPALQCPGRTGFAATVEVALPQHCR